MKRKETTKNSMKKRMSFSFFKKHKAFMVSLIIAVAAVASFLVVNYGRYVKEIIEVYYLRTKNFYFSSDKLTITSKTYEINPWSGTVPYSIDINMSSMLNSLKGATSNISYNVSCSTDSRIVCYFGSMGTTSVSRTIDSVSHADNFTVIVAQASGVTLNNGDVVSVTITATSTAPYEETLSAKFNLVIGDYGVNYSIEDVTGRLYFDSIVSNTKDTTPVRIKLTITNITAVSFDMANTILEAPTTTTELAALNGYQYIKSITFDVPPKSSVMVRYYKNSPNNNYTYNSVGSPIVTMQEL